MYTSENITNLAVAFVPDLRRTLFHSVAGFLYYSSTTEPLLILIPIKGARPNLKALCRW